MKPVIRSGARVLLRPLEPDERPQPGQIALARVRGTWYLHRVRAVDGERVQIANERGHVNGWTHRRNVAGVVSEIDNG